VNDSSIKTLALAAMILGAALLSGSAFAQAAAPAPAPDAAATAPTDAAPAEPKKMKPHKKLAPTVVVLVTNSRSVALTELDAAPTGGAPAKQIVADLAPGKKLTVKVPHGKSCVFDLHGAYSEGTRTDLTSIDLCHDKKVNLID
jgi:hypothetical protein